MAATWVTHRLRTALVHGNLMLIVLGLLADSELSEWELMNELFTRCASLPTSKEFRRLVDELVEGGYTSAAVEGGTRKLRITSHGRTLLRRLQDEYREVASSLRDGGAGSVTR
jgi:DNA-binding PadR family transcriptional regulator